MSKKRIIGILIAVLLDILTLVLGSIGAFISLFSGHFLAAGIMFFAILILLIVIPLVAVLVTKDRPIKITDKQMTYHTVSGSEEKYLGLNEVRRIASRYQYGFFLGKTAKAIVNQTNMVTVKLEDARKAVDNRFERGSITWDRYMGVVDSAADTAVGNLDMMARRISVLDEKEYASLANPIKNLGRNADSSGRLEFYRDNKSSIEKGLSENQEMFNKLDKLALELQYSADNQAKTDAVVQDIEDITSQVKYYN